VAPCTVCPRRAFDEGWEECGHVVTR
jgi:hypothetical protein